MKNKTPTIGQEVEFEMKRSSLSSPPLTYKGKVLSTSNILGGQIKVKVDGVKEEFIIRLDSIIK